MSDYSKINIVYRLQKWMDSVPGQTFLNYAYSWGASIVILGTLFTLTHLPGANLMLFIGMGTEVFVFFLSAFDRPFDKTADGRDIPVHVTEEYLEGKDPKNGFQTSTGTTVPASSKDDVQASQQPIAQVSPANVAQPSPANVIQPSQANVAQPSSSLDSQSELLETQSRYIDELKKLVDTLGKVNEQSARLTRDSEEMENLNRTLTGISKVYEMQLKSASQQIGTIDQINEQSKKMAQQIEQLNKIYARMIGAMTINMRTAAPNMSSKTEE